MSENYIYHHGIQGQKWGVRRYQNPDGTLTSAGKERYAKQTFNELKKAHNPRGNTLVIPYGSGVYVHHDNGARRRQRNSAKINEKIKTSFNKNATDEDVKKIKKATDALNDAVLKEHKLNHRPIPRDMTQEQSKKWAKQEEEAYLNTMRKGNALRKELSGVGSRIANDLLGTYADTKIADIKNGSKSSSAREVLQSDIYRMVDDLLKERR